MNRDSIIGIILIAALFVGYVIYSSPSKEELAKQQRVADSIALVQNNRVDSLNRVKALAEKKTKKKQENVVVAGKDTVTSTANVQTDLIEKYGAFANAKIGKKEFFSIETDLYDIKLLNEGGRVYSVQLKNFVTYDSLPLILFDSDTSSFGLNFFSRNRNINTNNFFFEPYINGKKIIQGEKIKITGDEKKQIAFRLYPNTPDSQYDKKSYIEYLYTISGDNYMMDMDIRFVNFGDYVDPGTSFVNLDWKENLRRQDRGVDRTNGYGVYYKYHGDDVENITENKDGSEDLSTKVKWVSFKQHFFSSTIIAKDAFLDGKVEAIKDENASSDRYLTTMQTNLGIPFQSNSNFGMSFYFGPNNFKILKDFKLDLERQIPIGWSFFLLAWINKYIVINVFDWLGSWGWNYGIVILVITILLKIVLFPIAYKMYLSSAKMRVLKPEIQEITKKYPKQEDAMKKQQETMALYRKAGVNPMAGCLPMLLQLPILIAMFRFFPSSIELRQKSFLWATDLSSYDTIYNFDFNIPFYGDHVSLFTLLMTISTLIYTHLNQKMMGQDTSGMPGMKVMMYLMPIFFLGFFNNYAAGLSYYYFLANVITFAQMFLFRQFVNEGKLREKIALNKKKKKKKSKWQQRLEDAQKQAAKNRKK
ncbi:MAG: membrane protein insertase YidC [Bacteroidales bacterium]